MNFSRQGQTKNNEQNMNTNSVTKPSLVIASPMVGGPATYTKLLARELSLRGFTITVVSFQEVLSWPTGIRHLVYLWKVYRAGKGADLIYAQDPLGAGFPALLAAKLLRIPFVLKIVGDRAWETAVQRYGVTALLDDFVRQPKTRLLLRVVEALQTHTARCAHEIVVPSEYLKGIVTAWGIAPERITVIYNAFEPPTDVPSCATARTRLHIPHQHVFLSAGRLVPWKGCETLIQLIPRVLEALPDTVLYIAGDGPEREHLEALIEELQLEGQVVLLGQLPAPSLYLYMAASTGFVLNTGYEGLSHVLLEAMAMGTPVITTRVGGNPEVITDGEDGVLVAYNDEKALLAALVRLATSPAVARRLTAAAHEKVRMFSEERMLAALITVLTLSKNTKKP